MNTNADQYTADFAPESLNTTDLISLPSLSEFKSQTIFAARKVTDFARLANVQITPADNGDYLLRTPNSTNFVLTAAANGSDVFANFIHDPRGGIAPSFSLQLPEKYTLADLAQQFDLTTITVGNKRVYQVRLGGYPKSEVLDNLKKELEVAFVQGKNTPDFRCTGRWYTTYPRDTGAEPEKFAAQQNPEYEYRGAKYVRYANFFANKWFKVEPLTFWVENSAAVKKQTATQLDLICAEVVTGNIPFFPRQHATNQYASLWQNSFARAFLNSADSRQLDGNPSAVADCQWDFTQGGFLQQALNMTREPIREYTIPATETIIAGISFIGCRGLEKIIIPSQVKRIDGIPFDLCGKLRLQIELSPTGRLDIANTAFIGTEFAYIYLPKTMDGKWLTVSHQIEPELENNHHRIEFSPEVLQKFLDSNYRQNFIQLHQWKQNQQTKFIPPEFTLEIFPATEMKNYFIHNNHKRWAELVQTLHFDRLGEPWKTNSLTDLMKIYYALGGFSAHQGERDRAFNYVTQCVANFATMNRDNIYYYQTIDKIKKYPDQAEELKARHIGDQIHLRFSRLTLNGPHNPTFAQFFMKYYHKNNSFMTFDFDNSTCQDYLCAAHNSFNQIMETYPNRVVNGNTERNLLTPEFVAKHCAFVHYQNVDPDNQELATTVGQYGYTQEQFEEIQSIFNYAKIAKDKYVICADRAVEENGISFRVLKKDDPLGFVIGDITNCCQHIGGVGDSCVRDGYTNINAGFLVFEESLRDKNGTPTGDKRILGQAYVWYDPKTLTVCYDNIEMPDKVLDELKHGAKHQKKLSMNTLMQAVINSADAIMTTMNQNGTAVKRVTVGRGYNDLNQALSKHFTLTSQPAQHRSYQGYTDAKAQYLIRTYDETTAKLANEILDTAAQIMQANKMAQASVAREL